MRLEAACTSRPAPSALRNRRPDSGALRCGVVGLLLGRVKAWMAVLCVNQYRPRHTWDATQARAYSRRTAARRMGTREAVKVQGRVAITYSFTSDPTPALPPACAFRLLLLLLVVYVGLLPSRCGGCCCCRRAAVELRVRCRKCDG